MAEFGFVLFSCFPAEFSNTALVSELTMLLELDDVEPSKAGLAYVGIHLPALPGMRAGVRGSEPGIHGRLGERALWDYQAGATKELENARDAGIAAHEAEDSFEEATQAFIKKDVRTIAENYAKRHGIERADEMVKTFRGILSKWVDRVADVNNAGELAELYWNEIYSKVDVSSYGLSFDAIPTLARRRRRGPVELTVCTVSTPENGRRFTTRPCTAKLSRWTQVPTCSASCS